MAKRPMHPEPDGQYPHRAGAQKLPDLSDRQFDFSSELAAKLYPDDLNLLEHLEEAIAAFPCRGSSIGRWRKWLESTSEGRPSGGRGAN